jgi:hypothetical protein
MLENYAVLNYCGLSKILKKHDKCTGFVTREKFMINMVVRQVGFDPTSHFSPNLPLLIRGHAFLAVRPLPRTEGVAANYRGGV